MHMTNSALLRNAQIIHVYQNQILFKLHLLQWKVFVLPCALRQQLALVLGAVAPEFNDDLNDVALFWFCQPTKLKVAESHNVLHSVVFISAVLVGISQLSVTFVVYVGGK